MTYVTRTIKCRSLNASEIMCGQYFVLLQEQNERKEPLPLEERTVYMIVDNVVQTLIEICDIQPAKNKDDFDHIYQQYQAMVLAVDIATGKYKMFDEEDEVIALDSVEFLTNI